MQAQNQAPAGPPIDSPVDLDWSAPGECPDANAVRSEVVRLTGATTRGSRHLKAHVSIRSTDGTGWILSLTTELDGVSGERTLSAVSCDSLTEAAALVLALILNPDLAVKAPPPVGDQPSTPRTATLASANDRGVRPRWLVGGYAGVQRGVLEDPSASLALSLGVALGRLSLRLMPSLTPPQEVFVTDSQPQVGGRLWLATVAALGCSAVALGPVALSPCVGLDVTRLQGHGLGVLQPREKTVYWTSAELAVFAGLPVEHGVRLEVGGIGLLPFRRPSVYLDGIGSVSRPAAFGFKALGGLAWFFE